MQFPFRLRRAVGPGHDRRDHLRRFKINAKIDPKKIRGPKMTRRRFVRRLEKSKAPDGRRARGAPDGALPPRPRETSARR